MVKNVPKSGGGKRGHGDPQFLVSLEIIQKNRIKKEINQQLFEIKVVSVPEFGDRSRRQWPVRITKRVESRHANAGHDAVANDGDRKNVAEKSRDEAGPTGVPGVRRAVHAAKERLRKGRDGQEAMDILRKILRKKADEQRPRE